ncbi:hypothetical protein [Salinispora fenicalii]|uniref:hypothetical protein n=1 Tax=Salinispora fenicalii TaxID=1137263 RepID=UPI001CC4B858|nr:hypothetical protein [Salinispora fenicalii]
MAAQVDPEWWSSGLWNGRPISELLQRHDITAIFRFVHARGVSYGRIAALVGLSPHRATEIAKGVRQVTAYEVLERIAVGLHIPRPVMGLGRDEDSTTPRDVSIETGAGGADQSPARVGSSEAGRLVRLRLGLDEALAASSVAPRQLELIEQSAGEHLRVYPSASPQTMLALLATDCREVQVLSLRRQPAAVQARLSGMAALLAIVVGCPGGCGPGACPGQNRCHRAGAVGRRAGTPAVRSGWRRGHRRGVQIPGEAAVALPLRRVHLAQ